MGGNIVKNSSPIESWRVMSITLDLERMLGILLTPIGSSANYDFPIMCNDIDYMVTLDKESFFKLADTIEDSSVNIGFEIISFPYYTTIDGVEKVIQIDLIRTDNPKFCQFAYYSCPKSKYKGVYRNLLLHSVVKHTKLLDRKNQRIRLSWNMDKGLFFVYETLPNNKFTKMIKNKTIMLTDSADTMTEIVFGLDYKAKDIMSFENLLEIVRKEFYGTLKYSDIINDMNHELTTKGLEKISIL